MSRTSSAIVGLAMAVFGTAAEASQGPGIAVGTAGTTTQLAMAIIIYGGSAALIAWGLIGAVRHR